MAISINTNIGAIPASAASSAINRSLETSMERLSTGKRINAAADDAAGVAIASRLTAEVRGTNQAIRNALDAQALIDTAEGAHEEVVNILQRMRELAVQGANDTNNSTDRTNLEAELDALLAEIDRIAATTTWAGKTLLNAVTDPDTIAAVATSNEITPAWVASTATAKTTELKFHVGSSTNAANTLTANIRGIGTTDLTLADADIDVSTNAAALRAVILIDNAIMNVNTQRAELGSISNRLDSTVSNLTNVATNLEAGRGRIEDADFAAETTNLAKSQILQQASMAMLAQANASKQGVLSLLQR
jgi:flagellin